MILTYPNVSVYLSDGVSGALPSRRVLAASVYLLGLLLGFCSGFASAAPVTALAEQTRDSYTLLLEWQEEVEFTASQEERDLIVIFSRPLENDNILELAQQAESWILDARPAYDSLLLRASIDADFTVTQEGRVIQFVITRASKGRRGTSADSTLSVEQAEVERIKERQRLRVKIIKARALTESGGFAEGRVLLQEVLDEYPDFIEARLQLAELENRAGRWRSALRGYNRALSSVDDPAAAEAKANLLWHHGQQTSAGMRSIDSESGEFQWQRTLAGDIFMGAGWVLSMDYESRAIDLPSVTNASGVARPFRGDTHHLRLSVSQELIDAVEITGNLFLTPGGIGGGGSLTNEILNGRMGVGVALRKPYWDSPVALVENGVADQLYLFRSQVLLPRWTSRVSVGFNRYSMDGATNAARSIGGALAVNHEPRVPDLNLNLGYSLDLEKALREESRMDVNGATFRPFDVNEREVHTLGAFIGKPWTDYLDLGMSLSYSVDRLGGSGPGIGIQAAYRPLTPYEVRLDAGYSSVSSRGGDENSTTTIGVTAGYHY